MPVLMHWVVYFYLQCRLLLSQQLSGHACDRDELCILEGSSLSSLLRSFELSIFSSLSRKTYVCDRETIAGWPLNVCLYILL